MPIERELRSVSPAQKLFPACQARHLRPPVARCCRPPRRNNGRTPALGDRRATPARPHPWACRCNAGSARRRAHAPLAVVGRGLEFLSERPVGGHAGRRSADRGPSCPPIALRSIVPSGAVAATVIILFPFRAAAGRRRGAAVGADDAAGGAASRRRPRRRPRVCWRRPPIRAPEAPPTAAPPRRDPAGNRSRRAPAWSPEQTVSEMTFFIPIPPSGRSPASIEETCSRPRVFAGSIRVSRRLRRSFHGSTCRMRQTA